MCPLFSLTWDVHDGGKFDGCPDPGIDFVDFVGVGPPDRPETPLASTFFPGRPGEADRWVERAEEWERAEEEGAEERAEEVAEAA